MPRKKQDEAIAKKLLKEKFDIDIEFLSLFFNKDNKNYAESLEVFKFLFNYEEADLKRVIWNSLCLYDIKKTDKNDFTDNEYKFLEKYLYCYEKRFSVNTETNVNRSHKAERVTLRPYDNNNKDWQIYENNIKAGGDFKLYACLKPTKENFSRFACVNKALYFVIEDNETKEPVGHIGLHRYNKNLKSAGIEYYIFKQYRGNGYAKEAIKKLIQLAFTKKLLMNYETEWDYVYKPKHITIDLIRAKIRADNIPSQRTVESCGFVHEGTIHKDYYMDFPPYIVDKEVYYIDKSFWNCKGE